MEISVVIPALNEEGAIMRTILEIPVSELGKMGYGVEVIVVDNGSTDRTAELALLAGARVVSEPRMGYGLAYKAGFARSRGSIIATGDADSSYPFSGLPALVSKLEAGNLDFITTDRISMLRAGAISRVNLVGNIILTFLVRSLFGVNIRDSQSGMWVFRKGILPRLEIASDGMAFSQELKLEAYTKGLRCAEVPIAYRKRVGKVKLRTLRDGLSNAISLLRKRLSYWLKGLG
ncbi:MAG: glycosyltransferase family 2 protein [Candidatus Diapherotrites archaeon]|uniref:Glycosyltransferase family 2 protein n=1 Tax=Candidatus Iainarchaeum sp. TaxID=3101447 RepID=A0A8T3YS41_9ARCH|nr:glycosyltransferase family 2 protein [Candidatus Diapherotrites archaeon]